MNSLFFDSISNAISIVFSSLSILISYVSFSGIS